ncbi:PDZ domain-containing protein [Rasiella rasia]|uniref:PDZ domain-containing protein n=1 Tax=Rasiella rasia TaxID=2744027 RepID=A0A6G6GMW0_9FLAO|nr:S41 family peptidase [Rasiella rasia]QIE59878.1 PDZ domain-containing protein [Rasiella rasia]
MKKRIILPIVAALIFCTTVGFKSDFFEIAKQIEIFTTMYKELNMNYVDEVTPATLMDKAIKGMLEDLDPYTVYWNEQEVEDARIQNSGTYTGIGASVKTLKDKIIIMEPFKDYPADKAGLKAGDEIVKVGTTALADFENDAGELLKGASGSTVEITYKRQGKTQTTTLTREKVDVKAVPYFKLLDNNIGYIVLQKFNRRTTVETKAALLELKNQGADKIILDLRGNPGGLLNEAISIVNLFVPKGEVITTTKSTIVKYNKTYKTTKEPVDTEIPLVVLVNGRSASASEIVSGGLQDLDRAVVVGARSFGKGLVQRPKKLTYGTQLKVTISRYYTPSGRCIQALDYWNRDENGDPVRVDSKEYNKFKTKGGRTVYDGGGILPDVEVETAVFSPITTALLKDQAIFDYATEYYYNNSMDNWNGFEVTDADFQNFITFLKSQNFEYETETEKEFAEALRRAEADDIEKEIANSYKQLMDAIDAAKDKKVIAKKAEIKSLLTDEILKRYFYKEGLYDYQVVNNPEILAGIEVLTNSGKYNRILKK